MFGDRAHEESASKEHDFHETSKVSKKVECSVDFPLVVQLIGSELENEVSVVPHWWVHGVIRSYVEWLKRSVVIKFEVFCLTKLKVLVLRFNLVDSNREFSAGYFITIKLDGSGPLYGFSRGFIAIFCEIKRILDYIEMEESSGEKLLNLSFIFLTMRSHTACYYQVYPCCISWCIFRIVFEIQF